LTAAVLCIVWVLWPLLAFDGGLAFNLVAAIAALPLLGNLRHFRPRWYMAPLAAFFLYAAVSALWSPQHFKIVEIDFARHAFNVRSEVLRVGLLFIAIAVLMIAAARLSEKGKRRVGQFAVGGLLAQLTIVALLAAFDKDALDLIAPLASSQGEIIQNISRNALIMGVAGPSLLLGLVGGRPWRIAIPVGLAILAIEGASIYTNQSAKAAILALAAAGACAALVKLMPRNGFRVLSVAVVLPILSAPVLFGVMTRSADATLATDSATIRLAIWRRAIDVIVEHPIFGSGLGVLRTLKERIPSGVFAGDLYMPNHPHNMALQLWAETGLVGAILLSLAIVLAGWRLPAPGRLGDGGLRAAALVGGMMVICFVSFDLWREWWWAVGGLLAVLALCQPAGEARPGEAAAAPSHASDGTENNFHLLRLLFALAVVAGHLNVLPALPGWQAADRYLAPAVKLGVQGFFILSGFLVSGSLERSKSIRQYAEKRVRRLYPAYAAVVLACAGAALAFGPQARAELGAVARYVGWNLGFLNFMAPNLPGVFAHNSMTAVNGALWTLKIEVLFYLVLPLIAWLMRNAGRAHWLLIVAIYIAAEAWRFGFSYVGEARGNPTLIEIGRQLPGQMSFFITGVALYVWRDRLVGRWWFLAPIGALLLVASFFGPVLEPLRAAGLGLVALWIATALPRLIDAARFGDLSYGVYILHFPIIQTVIALGFFAVAPALGAGVALAAILAASLAMWWLIERPALRADSAYRQRAVRDQPAPA
jgi:peptidoglycan/LPS O-acetylase OafA/YrhL/O-antigen ligase